MQVIWVTNSPSHPENDNKILRIENFKREELTTLRSLKEKVEQVLDIPFENQRLLPPEDILGKITGEAQFETEGFTVPSDDDEMLSEDVLSKGLKLQGRKRPAQAMPDAGMPPPPPPPFVDVME